MGILNETSVKVIVPVYKVENYLRRCVDSILQQDYSNYSVSLVDDGSPDASGSMCDELSLDDNRIITIHKKNNGLSHTRNTALDLEFACGSCDWITFVDSDDGIRKDFLHRMVAANHKNNTKICSCQYKLCDDFEGIGTISSGDALVLIPEDVYHKMGGGIRLYAPLC